MPSIHRLAPPMMVPPSAAPLPSSRGNGAAATVNLPAEPSMKSRSSPVDSSSMPTLPDLNASWAASVVRPVLDAYPFFTMSVHHCATFTASGWSKSTLVASPLRPLSLSQYWSPLVASNCSRYQP